MGEKDKTAEKRKKGKNGEGSVERLPSGTYRCVIGSTLIKSNGKYIRFTGTGKTEEEARANARKNKKIKERAYKEGTDYISGKNVLFWQYVEDYLNQKKKGRIGNGTFRAYWDKYEAYIKKYEKVANVQTSNMSVKLFQDYYNSLTSKFAVSTIKYPIQLCGQVCDWLVDRGIIDVNYARQAKPMYPIKDELKENATDEVEASEMEENVLTDAFDEDAYFSIEEEGIKKAFTDEDYKKFVEALDLPIKSDYAPVAVFLCETGLRPSEFIVLLDKDISIEKKLVKVNKSIARRYTDDGHKNTELYIKYNKTKETRLVPLSNMAIKAVKRMQYSVKNECKNNKKSIFYPNFRTGEYRDISAMEVGFKLLCDKLKIDRDVHLTPGGNKKGLNLYACRHTCETMLNKKGVNPLYVAKMLGHKPETGLKHYTHLTIEDLQKVNMSPYDRLSENEKVEKSADSDLLSGFSTDDEKRLLRQLLLKYKDDIANLLNE